MKKIVLGVGIAVILLGTGAAFYFLSKPTEAPLFSSLSDGQKAQVTAYLSQHSVPFSIQQNEIYTDSALIGALRMELIEQGVIQPQSQGFELFAKTDYGMTEFAQKVNYQRAIQGELERTIMSIEGVQRSRVHIREEKKSGLFQAQRPPSASVVLTLAAGFSPSEKTIHGIRLLVSASVGAELEAVAILDQYGQILSALAKGDEPHQPDNDIKQGFIDAASSIIAQWLPKEQFTVSAMVELSKDKRRKRIEGITNDSQSVVLKKKENLGAKRNDNDKSDKVPVTSEVEYLYGKTVEEVEFAPGQIKKVSMGIVLSPKQPLPISIDSIKKVVQGAVGLDLSRGDQLEVIITEWVDLQAQSEAPAIVAVQPWQSEAVSAQVLPAALTTNNSTGNHNNSDETIELYQLSAMGLVILLLLLVALGLSYRARQIKADKAQRQQVMLFLDQWLEA